MRKIIFVYNADSGPIHGLKDMIHKVVSPETYPCNLCAITYGTFGMRARWRSFIDNLDVEVEFLHRDELDDHHGLIDASLPAAFISTDSGEPVEIIDADVMRSFSSLEELMEAVSGAIARLESSES